MKRSKKKSENNEGRGALQMYVPKEKKKDKATKKLVMMDSPHNGIQIILKFSMTMTMTLTMTHILKITTTLTLSLTLTLTATLTLTLTL